MSYAYSIELFVRITFISVFRNCKLIIFQNYEIVNSFSEHIFAFLKFC